MIYDTKKYARSILFAAAWSIWGLFLMNFAAIRFNIYYTLSWFDTFVHFCGGMVTALVVLVILMRLKINVYKNPVRFFITLIVLSFCVGVFWELVEFVVNYYIPTYSLDFVDITTDLIADTAGAAVVTLALFVQQQKHIHGTK